MRWEYPVFLFVLLLLPLIAVFILIVERRRRLYLRNRVRPEGLILISYTRLVLKRILLMLACVFLLVALAGPRWGRVWQKIIKPGKDLIFVIDTSVSMFARDLKPSRMEVARDKIKLIVESMKGVRAGLIFFAGTAFTQCPVTFDKGALKLFLSEAWDNLIPLPGSNIEEALKLSIDSFPPAKELSERYVVLITDGEELQGNAVKVIDELRKARIKVVSFGLATTEGGPIPLYSNGRLTGYKKDKQGNTVLTRLNAGMLNELAEKTGGVFLRAGKDASDIGKILEIIEKGASRKMEDDVSLGREYRYQYPLFAALLLLLIEFIISERKKKIRQS